MAQIELKDISKHFTVSERPKGNHAAFRSLFHRENHRVEALKHIGFSIEEGELVGYIGPNGAGKSTTVKVMSGILTPEEGECRILGRTPWRERASHVANIGVVFGQRSQLWWDVPTRDSFELLRDIYGIPANLYGERLGELTCALDLEKLLSIPVRQLSLGQRMRCEVAAALLHRPRILFLDEPTIGLDAVSKLSLRQFLKEENQKNGVTMILTTHDMDDVEALCSRVMTIGHGRLLYDGTLQELKETYAPLHRIRATLQENVQLPENFPKGILRWELEGKTYTAIFDSRSTPAHLLISALAKLLPLQDIVVEEQSVDEMVASMYRSLDLS